MDFKVSRDELIRVVSSVSGVIERTPSRLILLNLRLIVRDNKLFVQGTDGKIYLQDTCDLDEMATPGDVTIEAKSFERWFKELPDAQVHFQVDDRYWVTIHCNRVSSHNPALPSDDYPEWPVQMDTLSEAVEMESGTFSQLLNKTFFNMSDDDSRPAICGCYFENKNKWTTMAATDGHRLALAESDAMKLEQEFSTIIPRKMVHQLRRLLTEASGIMSFSYSETFQVFSWDTLTLVSKQVAGSFPSFRAILPSEYHYSIGFAHTDMKDALRRALVYQNHPSNGMGINIGDGLLHISVENTERGDVHENMDVEYDGDPITVCYNPRFIQELLGAISTDRVWIKLDKVDGPCIFVEDGEHDPRLTYVVMPIRMRDQS